MRRRKKMMMKMKRVRKLLTLRVEHKQGSTIIVMTAKIKQRKIQSGEETSTYNKERRGAPSILLDLLNSIEDFAWISLTCESRF
jgi:hypothetical protein